MTAPDGLAPDSFHSDRPIRSLSEDQFGRKPFAEFLVEQMSSLPRGESYVLGLLGGPGSGKSSLLNLIEDKIGRDPDRIVLRLEPWVFSGGGRLVMELMTELSLQLVDKKSVWLRDVGNALENLTELMSPARYLPKSAGAVVQTNDAQLVTRPKRFDSYKMRRRELEVTLAEATMRFIILIDTVDQLHPEEIRQLMMLLRTVLNLPNMIYLLAFDRAVVEAKLKTLSRLDGEVKAWVDRTCQINYEVPPIDTAEWAVFITTEINHFIKGTNRGPFREQDWNDVFYSVLLPLFATPRDVYRYTNALPLTLAQIGAEVALVDVLALEAMRIVLPDVFGKLPAAAEALTGTEAQNDEKTRTALYGTFEELLLSGGRHTGIVRELCFWLFPITRRFMGDPYFDPGWPKAWRKGRRVADPDVLRFYLQRTLPEGALPAHVIDSTLHALSDAQGLGSLLSNMGPDALEHLLRRLEDYDHDYPAQAVAVALPVLLNQSVRLREGLRDQHDLGADRQLSCVVTQMLLRLSDEADRVALVRSTLPLIESLSRRLHLLRLCGPSEPVLLPEAQVRPLMQQLRAEVLSSPPARLAKERDLFTLLQWAAAPQQANLSPLVRDDGVFLQLLHSALGEYYVPDPAFPAQEAARQAMLPWEALEALLGRDLLHRRVQAVAQSTKAASANLDERTNEAVELAGRYATGWRPPAEPTAFAIELGSDMLVLSDGPS